MFEWIVGSTHAVVCANDAFNQFLWWINDLIWILCFVSEGLELDLSSLDSIDDSPPSIRIKIMSGSGTFEPSGVLAVLPGTTLYLDCMYPKKKGSPDWTWTGWHRTYQTSTLTCYFAQTTVPFQIRNLYYLFIVQIGSIHQMNGQQNSEWLSKIFSNKNRAPTFVHLLVDLPIVLVSLLRVCFKIGRFAQLWWNT